jgi:hypothetical protein
MSSWGVCKPSRYPTFSSSAPMNDSQQFVSCDSGIGVLYMENFCTCHVDWCGNVDGHLFELFNLSIEAVQKFGDLAKIIIRSNVMK